MCECVIDTLMIFERYFSLKNILCPLKNENNILCRKQTFLKNIVFIAVSSASNAIEHKGLFSRTLFCYNKHFCGIIWFHHIFIGLDLLKKKHMGNLADVYWQLN